MENKIRNTEEEAKTKQGSAGFFAEAMLDAMAGRSSSDFIERMEAQGQQQFVQSEVLPKDFGYKKEGKEALEKAGVVFGEDVPGDDLFCYVTLPAGWKKVPTDHSMWSSLLDEKGRKRAGIFYKAAFYDRSAHVSVSTCYSYGYEPVGGWEATNNLTDEEKQWHGYVTDAGETAPIYYTLSRPSDPRGYGHGDVVSKEAETWLNEHYPDWKNPSSYWED